MTCMNLDRETMNIYHFFVVYNNTNFTVRFCIPVKFDIIYTYVFFLILPKITNADFGFLKEKKAPWSSAPFGVSGLIPLDTNTD